MSSRQNRSLSWSSAASTVSSEYSMASTMLYNPSIATEASEPDEFVENPLPLQPGGEIQLPCEFVGLCHCDSWFHTDQAGPWIEHIIEHLEGRIPPKAECWFCDTKPFDAGSHSPSKRLRDNFVKRMHHIHGHIVMEGKTADDMRPDYYMLKHLEHHGLVSAQRCRVARKFGEIQRPEGVYSPDFTPPEQEQQLYLANRVVVDPRRENRDRERRQHRGSRSRHH